MTTYKNNGVWEGKYKAYRDSAQAVATVWTDSMQRVISNVRYEAETYKTAAALQTAEVRRLTNENNRWHGKTDSLNKTLDSLIKIYGPLNPIVCAMCLVVRDSLNREIRGLYGTIVVFNNRDSTRLLEIATTNRTFLLQRQVSDSLRVVILRMPTPQSPPRLFGIFKMNNNQAFIAGAVVTIGSMFILRGKL